MCLHIASNTIINASLIQSIPHGAECRDKLVERKKEFKNLISMENNSVCEPLWYTIDNIFSRKNISICLITTTNYTNSAFSNFMPLPLNDNRNRKKLRQQLHPWLRLRASLEMLVTLPNQLCWLIIIILWKDISRAKKNTICYIIII